jgi:transposase InsO family protein
MVLVSALLLLIRSLIVHRTTLAAENLALRQQLAILNRKIHRPQLRRRDRFFWVILSRLWKNWREVLIIVKPETVIKWHRRGFKLYLRWKSKASVGRPKIDKEIRELIKRMSLENPLWGTPRIQSELRLLGFDLAESTVAKYRVRGSASPSQTWKTFLANHAKQIAAIDFFTVPTLTFSNLYCFIILLHDRRQVIHCNVTAHPTAEWTARQLIEAFPEDSAPRYLLRDRDQIYGAEFRLRVQGMQIEEVITAPRSPFQNPYAERVIGSIRRECLDHLIIIGEDHLRRILRDYLNYYHNSRPHQALERNSPIPREIEAPVKGKVIAMPQVGGLHHRYRRAA